MGGGGLVLGALNHLGFTSAFQVVADPFKRALSYDINYNSPNALPDPGQLVSFRIRKYITHAEYIQRMKNYGYNEQWAMRLYQSSYTYLSAYEYITLWRRQLLDDSQVNFFLEQLGLSGADIFNIKNVTEYFPTPSDLVQFAVREVYNPEIRKKFGMDEDISDIYLKEAAKTGMTPEHAKNFWAAHWQLPSIYQGFEMLHRRVIDEKELDQLMTAQDVMPFWREKLKKISYSPLTRVDVRRMWRFGVITDYQELVNSYRDIGYDTEKANRMAEFTVRYESDEMAGLTRSTVIGAYKDGIITREELTQYFSGFGYTERVIEFWISVADYEKTIENVKKIKDDIINRYLLGDIKLEGVRKELLEMDLPATYIDNILNDLKRQTSAKMKIPSKEDLLNWFDIRIIDDKTFYEKMSLLGYKQEDINNYLTYYMIDKPKVERRFLSVDVYKSWAIKSMMSIEKFIITMLDMKVHADDIYIMLDEIVSQNESIESISNDIIERVMYMRESGGYYENY